MKDWAIVIDDFDTSSAKLVVTPQKLKKACEEVFPHFFAYIYHDRDINEYEEPKTPHFHLVVGGAEFSNKKEILDLLCEKLEIKANLISVEPCKDLNSCIYYLVHFFDEDKYQYPIKSIITNKPSKIATLFKYERLTFAKLKECITFDEVVQRFGEKQVFNPKNKAMIDQFARTYGSDSKIISMQQMNTLKTTRIDNLEKELSDLQRLFNTLFDKQDF